MARAGIFFAKGYEEIEALTVVDICRRAGVEAVMVSVDETPSVESSHGVEVKMDAMLSEVDFDSFDILVLPGGMPGTLNLEACGPLMEQLDRFYESGRWVAAICDILVLPGGMPGTLNLEACGPLMEQLDRFYESGRWVAAICAAPQIFGHRGYLKGRRATSFPAMEKELDGAVVTHGAAEADGNVITGRGMGCAIDFRYGEGA